MAFLESSGQLDFPITAFSINEVKTVISKLNAKKAPGYDLITAKILKELPITGLKFITQLFNAVLRHSYFPKQWKVAEIILIPKPGKPLEEVTSYRPISLLPILSKTFEKLFLKRLKPILAQKHLIPDHQFGFREHHSTVEQVHIVYNTIRDAFERKEYCAAAFVDITQAFDKVWHKGLLYKLKINLPYPFFELLRSYLFERFFRIKLNDSVSGLYPIKSGVPQGSVLGPVLYTIFTADLPTDNNTNIATFADDTVMMACDLDPIKASTKLQTHINSFQKWLRKWRIEANASKSVQVTYTLKRQTCPAVTLNTVQLPQSDCAKYLGMHLDRKLTWQKHIFTKRKQLGLKLSSLNWLIGKNSNMTLDNKLLVYKTILKPIWTYGIQLWGSAAKTNIDIIQRFQSKVLRQLARAPRIVTNDTIHKDLSIATVSQEVNLYAMNYAKRLHNHPNTLANTLAEHSNLARRLKKAVPADLFI